MNKKNVKLGNIFKYYFLNSKNKSTMKNLDINDKQNRHIIIMKQLYAIIMLVHDYIKFLNLAMLQPNIRASGLVDYHRRMDQIVEKYDEKPQ